MTSSILSYAVVFIMCLLMLYVTVRLISLAVYKSYFQAKGDRIYAVAQEERSKTKTNDETKKEVALKVTERKIFFETGDEENEAIYHEPVKNEGGFT